MWKNESGSMLIQAMLFLFMITTFLSGMGIIVQNEAKEQQLLKDNYVAKAMIQMTYDQVAAKEDRVSQTIQFNHGTVNVTWPKETLMQCEATLENQYRFEKSFEVAAIEAEDELSEEQTEEDVNIEEKADNDEEKLEDKSVDNEATQPDISDDTSDSSNNLDSIEKENAGEDSIK